MNRIICFFILLLLFNKLQSQNEEKYYSFVVAGHTYGALGDNHVGLFPPFQAKYNYIANREGMEMCFLTGDIVRKPTSKDWDEVDEDIDSLKIDVYMVAGNHDLRDKPLFVSRYGQTYYSFKHRNDLLY